MFLVKLYTESSTDSIGVDETNGDEVVGSVEVTPVGDGEGFVSYGVRDGTPDVDETDAGLEETGGFGAEVSVDTGDAGFEGLVDVDAFLGF